MNYPVWDVAFGASLLMAIISILHVFVSHFAVGGGLFLVLTEKKALRDNSRPLLEWLKAHTRFFVLVTVVFGAVSGVGIWFTIGLINPSATSSLIHSYVWGWAIEWVFFFIEITAALLYMHGWDKISTRLHLWYGWVYFIAAFASMVIINGIVTFMLTSGKWIDTHAFWTGFFNPTFFPSLALRFCLSLALAGIYALVTASFQRDRELKGKLVKWSAAWIIPSFVLLPFLAWWYVRKVPSELWSSARGPMPTATHYASLISILAIATFVLSLLSLVKPQRLHPVFSFLIFLSALATMGAFEFTREAVRKPYIISNYMYGNSLYVTPMEGDGGFTVENIDQTGILHRAKWIQNRDLTNAGRTAVGREIFRVECQSCHTVNAYRGLRKYLDLRQWDPETIRAMLGSLDLMHNGVMPPFTGKDPEREALALYLTTIGSPKTDGVKAPTRTPLFERYCAPCHQRKKEEPLFTILGGMDPESADAALQDLQAIFVRMPNIKLNPQERAALSQWIMQQFPSGR
jgi:mono/diheme cytochrome c family protein/cytochrome bd-type quinol oxidase subunit 1